MRNPLLVVEDVVVKTVGNAWLACAKTTYLCTSKVFLPRLVYKASRLYTACSVFVPGLSHSQNRVFQSVNTVFLPTIHTTYKDNQKLINLFSY